MNRPAVPNPRAPIARRAGSLGAGVIVLRLLTAVALASVLSRSARPGSELRLSRAELEASSWRIVIPPDVGARLAEASAPPTP